MPKLAIYVPKKQMREIDRWRKKINFSQIFMKALSQEIAERSRDVSAADGELTAAAEFYRNKLAETSGPLIDIGFELGSRQVIDCQLSPEMILRLLKIDDVGTANEDELSALEEAIAPHAGRIDEFRQTHGYDERSYPNWRAVVQTGFLKGVAAAWQRVCERMKTE